MLRPGQEEMTCKQFKKVQEIKGVTRFRQGKDNNTCKAV